MGKGESQRTTFIETEISISKHKHRHAGYRNKTSLERHIDRQIQTQETDIKSDMSTVYKDISPYFCLISHNYSVFYRLRRI